jgi:hypothetical protein
MKEGPKRDKIRLHQRSQALLDAKMAEYDREDDVR